MLMMSCNVIMVNCLFKNSFSLLAAAQKDGVDELFDILFIQCKCGKLLVRLDGEFRWFRPPRQRRPRKGSQRLDSGKRQNRKMNSHSRRPYQSRNRPGAKPLFDGNGTILLARAVSTGLCEVVYVYEPGSPDEHTNPLCPSCTMPILQVGIGSM